MMMPAWAWLAVAGLTWTGHLHAEPDVTIDREGDDFVIAFVTEAGRSYEIWASAELTPDGWTGPLHSVEGTGTMLTATIPAGTLTTRFFRVRSTASAPEFAPSLTEFRGLVVGTILPGTNYQIIANDRFSWFGETGNWSYTKTGPDTATLVFTYDEDGNSPDIYREVIALTYTEEGAGTFQYAEYNDDTLDPGSVQTGPFSFN